MAQPEDGPPPGEKTNGSAKSNEKETSALRPISPASAGSDNDGGERPVREKLKKTSIGGLSKVAAAKAVPLEAGDMDENTMRAQATQEAGGKEDTLPRGRATRKRSFDDLQNDSVTTPDPNAGDDTPRRANHKRMRSRDVSGASDSSNEKPARDQVDPVAEDEDDDDARKSPGGAGIIVDTPIEAEETASGERSPQKKRSRDQFDKDASTADAGSDHPVDGDQATLSEANPKAGDVVSAPSPAKGEPEKKRPRDATQNTESSDGQTQTQTETQPETQNVC